MDNSLQLLVNNLVLKYITRLQRENGFKTPEELIAFLTTDAANLIGQEIDKDYKPEPPNTKPPVYVNGDGTEAGDMMARMNRG